MSILLFVARSWCSFSSRAVCSISAWRCWPAGWFCFATRSGNTRSPVCRRCCCSSVQRHASICPCARSKRDIAGGPVGIWLAAVGAGFGLLALSHALTIWIFVGALIFAVFFFRPRGWARDHVLAPVRDRLFAVVDSEFRRLRQSRRRRDLFALSTASDTAKRAGCANREFRSGSRVARRIPRQDRRQLDSAKLVASFEYFGWSVVALMFFVALLHPLQAPETAAMRWLVLAMWVGAVLGMAIYGINEEQGVAANQLHLLFIPIMTCFGLAYLLVQWNRLEIELRVRAHRFHHAAFLALRDADDFRHAVAFAAETVGTLAALRSALSGC